MREVAGPTLRIGRGSGNDLCLEDPSVQLQHAVIQEIGGAFILRDLGDGSLTAVNDKPAKEAILTAKGTIRIGPYILRFARPNPKAPLTIEYENLTESASTDEDETTAETMVLPASPFAAKSAPVDLDATAEIKPDDLPTLKKPPTEAASAPADPDATQTLNPMNDTPPS